MSPKPQVIYDELYYPDSSDLGKGKYSIFLKKDVLLSQKIVDYVFMNFDYDIGIDVAIYKESESILAEFYLLRPRKSEPVLARVFLIPIKTPPGEEHEIVVNFANHIITGVDMDGKALVELEEGAEY